MSDDNVTYLPGFSKHPPRFATVTDIVPGSVLELLGLGMGIPHSEGSTRVGFTTLRELRRRAMAAEHHANLAHIEYQKLVRHLSDLIGDDDGGAA